MNDDRIIQLYLQRDENAIGETASKYGRFCYSIAHNILSLPQDCEECVNDTYLGAWNAIPPVIPTILSSFLGKITRNISINKWKAQNRQKRRSDTVSVALDELSECIPSDFDTEEQITTRELTEIINEFLHTLPSDECNLFVCRYWYLASVDELCAKFNYSKSKVKSQLFRTRKKLRQCLSEEGYI